MGPGAAGAGKWAVGGKQEKSSTGLEKSRIKTVVQAGRKREGFEGFGVMGWGRPGRELRMIPEAMACALIPAVCTKLRSVHSRHWEGSQRAAGKQHVPGQAGGAEAFVAVGTLVGTALIGRA